MQMFIELSTVYLHRDPVDFRKSINGLSIIVETDMSLSALSGALFVFCNKKRDKLKLLYWDKTGFALWYKRLEQEKFKWPRKMNHDTIELSETQLHWLLDGYDITKMQPHAHLNYQTLL
ncbi:MAG: IS66 family insertion sequence element accessory protein TnpB [Thiohalomonadales bacterium]